MDNALELLNIDCLGKPLRLEASLAGWQQLFWDNHLVSEKSASADNQGLRVHEFQLQSANAELPLQIRLETDLIWQPFTLDFRLLIDDEVVNQGKRNARDLERQQPSIARPQERKLSLLGLGSLLFKLLKSAKVIKVALAGASLAAYSWLFSFQFALALILCLVVHEYGHVRAMKYFGMKTKGFYLIPFMGGVALTDDKINTRWQDVVIAIMGPVFGLLMSLTCLLVWWVTDNPLFAGLAAFNALLNLFNLLPILPLDGGHVVKSISFSMNSITGLLICVGGAIFGVYISYKLGLSLLGFLLLIGCAEIMLEWRTRHQSHLLPLDRYGQIFSAVWYLLTLGAFVAIIWFFAGTGDGNHILGLPLKILQS
ncbi:site-2 protease family protein [Shewanella sedimentimangrovi]|uniref:Site-2 protease family protein n=1 Tax=Shewanella sedimentimangrovi TaxID=2814293 RepID=A0ABX7R5I0_9GAMM|nr:site-2 protease family protein [Shewanella sedimentimangrovi]QSX38964.1 site-2 protease family protein [Shewanella sedimentimangrovi]